MLFSFCLQVCAILSTGFPDDDDSCSNWDVSSVINMDYSCGLLLLLVTADVTIFCLLLVYTHCHQFLFPCLLRQDFPDDGDISTWDVLIVIVVVCCCCLLLLIVIIIFACLRALSSISFPLLAPTEFPP